MTIIDEAKITIVNVETALYGRVYVIIIIRYLGNGKMAKSHDKSPTFNVYGLISLNKISNTFFLRCTVSKTVQSSNHFESFCHTFT